MRIVVTCKERTIAPLFAQSTNFTCYDVNRGIIVSSRNIPVTDQAPEKLVELAEAIGADAIITGYIEYDTALELCRRNIDIVPDVFGEPLDGARAYLMRTLCGMCESFSEDTGLSDNTSVGATSE